MRICRFTSPKFPIPRFGIIEGESIRPLTQGETIASFPSPRTDAPISLATARLVAPVAPSKIVCVGRNYKDHAAEMGNPMPEEPLIFLKAPSAIIGNGEKILLPPESSQVEHEGELGVVIGRTASHVEDEDDPLSF